MARLIEPTPTLEGESKKRFIESLQKNKFSQKKEDFLAECKDLLKKIKIDA